MNRLTFADVTPPAPTDQAAEILSATKVTLLKIAIVMTLLVFITRHYLQ